MKFLLFVRLTDLTYVLFSYRYTYCRVRPATQVSFLWFYHDLFPYMYYSMIYRAVPQRGR
jgi:hypothetical protein